MSFIKYASLILLVSLLTGCEKNYILEQNQPLDNNRWDYSDVRVFNAEIKDTSINYNIFINVRHAFDFEWRNLWVKIETRFPDGRELEKRVNIVLAEPDGRWLGRCIGDNCDRQVMIQEKAFFPTPGKYTFKISQDMRVNPLPAVKSIGMEIKTEK